MPTIGKKSFPGERPSQRNRLDCGCCLGVSAEYGRVRKGDPNMNLIGVFLDLGGGVDSYGTDVVEIGNELVWHLAPVGDGVDPARHKGVGIDE